MVYKYGHTITPANNPQSPHIIPLGEDSILSETPLPITTDIQYLPLTPTKDTTTEPSYENLNKNSVEPLSIHTLNLVHKDAKNLLPVPPSTTPAPSKNRTQFESLNLQRIFGCRRFRNQNHPTAVTNANLFNPGLLPYTIGSFATTANPPNRKPIKKRRQYLDKVHMEIVFGDCVSLGRHRYALLLVDLSTRY